MFSSPSSSAWSASRPTALALENSVGANATRPFSSNSGCAWSIASCPSDGTSSGAVLKNEVSAVEVYSG